MKKIIYIGNRQVGKSTMAINRFSEDPENSLLITKDQNHVSNLEKILNKKFNIFSNNIISSEYGGIKGKRIDTIILDEFFYWNEENAIKIFEVIQSVISFGGTIIIYTSMNADAFINLRQELFLEQLYLADWKIKKINGGHIQKEKEIVSWLFKKNKFNETVY